MQPEAAPSSERSPSRGRADRIAGAILLALAVATGTAGARIEYAFSSDPLGPRVFPVLLAASLGACALWLLLRPGPSGTWPTGRLLAGKGVFVAGVALAVGLMNQIGFAAMATVVGGVTASLFGARPRLALLVGLSQAVLWDVIFTCGLGSYLPVGSWLTALLPGLSRLATCG